MSSNRMYYSQEAEQQAQQQRFILAVFVAALGMALGTVMTLLFAPQAGQKTRRELGNYLEESAAHGQQLAQQVGKNVRNQVNKVREDIEDRVNNN